jgi:hypothetical protein
MDERTYRETVIKLLAVQHEYFRLRKQSDLIESKRLEKVLREENARWLADPTPTLSILDERQNREGEKQANLFE